MPVASVVDMLIVALCRATYKNSSAILARFNPTGQDVQRSSMISCDEDLLATNHAAAA
ncbi:hypothetical protein ACPPVQ_18720 [Diaminobutyricibacter sp. McL0618]|uniref:hypothetical protein n=1 Tax=Leifsonia sp. McL0618 TaxID=3415677 RepID=UPI003CEC17BC